MKKIECLVEENRMLRWRKEMPRWRKEKLSRIKDLNFNVYFCLRLFQTIYQIFKLISNQSIQSQNEMVGTLCLQLIHKSNRFKTSLNDWFYCVLYIDCTHFCNQTSQTSKLFVQQDFRSNRHSSSSSNAFKKISTVVG